MKNTLLIAATLLLSANAFSYEVTKLSVQVIDNKSDYNLTNFFSVLDGPAIRSNLRSIAVAVRECVKDSNKTKSTLKSVRFSNGYVTSVDASKSVLEVTRKSIEQGSYEQPDSSISCQNTGLPSQVSKTHSFNFDKYSNENQEFNLPTGEKIILKVWRKS